MARLPQARPDHDVRDQNETRRIIMLAYREVAARLTQVEDAIREAEGA